MSVQMMASAAAAPPAKTRRAGKAEFERVILRLVTGGPERHAIDAGEIDAIVDTATGRALLLPAAQRAVIEGKAEALRLLALSWDWSWQQDEQHRFTTITDLSDRPGTAAAADLAHFIGHPLWDLRLENPGDVDWATHHTQLDWRVGFRDLELCIADARGQLRWISLAGMPVYDADDQFTGYRGGALEISLRKQAQQQTARQHEHALAALNALPLQVCVLDTAGTVVLCNRAWRDGEAELGLAAGVPEGSSYLVWCESATGFGRADGLAIADGIRQVMQAGDGACFEHRVGPDTDGRGGSRLQITGCVTGDQACTVVSRTVATPPVQG